MSIKGKMVKTRADKNVKRMNFQFKVVPGMRKTRLKKKEKLEFTPSASWKIHRVQLQLKFKD